MHSAGAGAAQLGRPAHRAAHGMSTRRRGLATALLGEPTAARRRRTGDGEERAAHRRGDGGAARHDGGGRAVRWPGRRSGRRGFRPRRSGRRRERRGERAGAVVRSGGGREADCRDARRAVPIAALSCRRRRGAWQPQGNGALPRGPGPARQRFLN
jgi:hypothetical protein